MKKIRKLWNAAYSEALPVGPAACGQSRRMAGSIDISDQVWKQSPHYGSLNENWIKNVIDEHVKTKQICIHTGNALNIYCLYHLERKLQHGCCQSRGKGF